MKQDNPTHTFISIPCHVIPRKPSEPFVAGMPMMMPSYDKATPQRHQKQVSQFQFLLKGLSTYALHFGSRRASQVSHDKYILTYNIYLFKGQRSFQPSQ